MPRKCCVPCCKSNYVSTSSASNSKEEGYVSVFMFPKEKDLYEKWKKCIPREDFIPTENSAVCIKHFEPACILKSYSYKDKSGNMQTFHYDRPKLKPGSFPTIFPGVPKYLNIATSPGRKSPESRRLENLQRQEESKKKLEQAKLKADTIENYASFKGAVVQKLQSFNASRKSDLQLTIRNNNRTLIYLLDFDTMICRFYVETDADLIPKIYCNNVPLCVNEIQFILSNSIKLDMWSKLEKILDHLLDKNYSISLVSAIADIIDKIDNIENKLIAEDDCEEKICRLSFLKEQLALIFKQQKRYSPKMIMTSYLIFMQSLKCYETLRSNNILTLPHPKYLQQLTASVNIAPENLSENNHFLKVLGDKLNKDCDRWVALELDEIYVKELVEYKSGKLKGFAENSMQLEEAKTIQAFLISGLFSSYEHVVNLTPVKGMTGQELATMTTKVVKLLENCGFKVLCIISDNNRMNQNMFSILRQNPEDTDVAVIPGIDHPVFIMFDTVHIAKCIRNNWINLKDSEKTFIFPSFHVSSIEDLEDQNALKAKFIDLRKVYKMETNKLIKKAFRLNHRTVFPSNFDKQKVVLALNVFPESTYAALQCYNFKETAEFISIIWKWWAIVNTKNCLSGKLKRNEYGEPFTTLDDERVLFLNQFVIWLQNWQQLAVRFEGGGLTRDTTQAIIQSTKTLVRVITYSLEVLQVKYVLPGKLQTDKLEKRFSMYRQFNGGNYNISVTQVMEAERKIRAKSLMGIKSARYGWIPLDVDNLDLAISSTDLIVNDESAKHILELLTDSKTDETAIDFDALIYVCGYAAFKVNNKLDCKNCAALFVGDEFGSDYVENINRGGLTVPSNIVVKIGKYALKVMHKLVSPELEAMFVNLSENHHALLRHMVKMTIYQDEQIVRLLSDSCLCSKPLSDTFAKIISVMCNILLSNYKKLRNNVIAAKKSNISVERKLRTLQ